MEYRDTGSNCELKRFTYAEVAAGLPELNFTINEYQLRLFSLDNVLFYYQLALARVLAWLFTTNRKP